MRATLTAAAVLIALIAIAGAAQQPGPVMQVIGPVVPTPIPSPKHEEHVRLISSFTLGNQPDGDTVIAFEATDFGISGPASKRDEQKYRTIASEQYTLVEPKPQARVLRDEIMRKVRDLERDLLRYVELTGAPRAREPITSEFGTRRP
ncbi:MAG: hypothetical protein AB7V27_08335 [Candidatus Binatia bacterium]